MIGNYEREDLGVMTFGLQIEGDHEKVTKVSLSLIKENAGVVVMGEVSGDEVSFDLSKIAESLKPGTYDTKLEVILDGNRYFAPVEDKIQIKVSPKVEAVAKDFATNTRPTVKVQTTLKSVMETKEQTWVKEQEAKGFTVLESSDHKRLFAMKNKVKVSEFKR
jgi:hypothetical protein